MLTIGTEILMVEPHGSEIEKGQTGRIIDESGEGLRIRWDDGRLTFFPDSSGAEITEIRNDTPHCDFCSAPCEGRWRCHVRRDRAVTGLIMIDERGSTEVSGRLNVDDWGACDACKQLVEAGKRGVLVKRSAKVHVRNYPMPLALAQIAIAQAHSEFWRGFTGEITEDR